MRLTNTFGGRPAYYDRNPTNKAQTFDSSLAPPAGVTEWTYTVPTARKAQLEGTYCALLRGVVATTAVRSSVTISHTPSGGTGQTINSAVFDATNTLNLFQRNTLGSGGTMLAGDAMACVVNSTDTGGSIEYAGNARITEYDA